MHIEQITGFVGMIAMACLVSCGNMETFPHVVISPNDSGIEIGAIRQEGPSNLLGTGWSSDGKPIPPDIPSRTVIEVKRVKPLHNKEPRYFIPASGTVQVVSVERYSDYDGADTLAKLRHLLSASSPSDDQRQKPIDTANLNEIPWFNAGKCFYGKLRRKSFPWGEAVLFLTSYVQGRTGGPVNNDMLVLVAQGLTKDGRYAVNAHFEIRHPMLPDSSWDERRKGKAVFSIDDECDQAEQWLDSQADESFQPTIGQYEKFLSSLVITAGRPNEKPAKPSISPLKPQRVSPQ